MIVDTHAHFVPPALLQALKSKSRSFPSIEVTEAGPSAKFSFAGKAPTRPVMPKLFDVAARKDWLEKEGITHQVIGGWLDIFGYELPAEEGAAWCDYMNEQMLAGAAALPAFAPLACVPLQNGKLAAKALEKALDAGFHGAMIGTQPKGEGGSLDDPELNPFWEMAAARKATIFLHPMFTCGDDRLNDFDLVNAAGRGTDTTIAVARLLFSGHLDRFDGVNLVISHGGGGVPYMLGRFKRNNAIHKGEYSDAETAFRKLYFDTVMFEPRALRYLCDVAGADKVMLGSDHPFPIGDDHPVKIVNETTLTLPERNAILSGTAVKLFNLPCTCGAGQAGHTHG